MNGRADVTILRLKSRGKMDEGFSGEIALRTQGSDKSYGTYRYTVRYQNDAVCALHVIDSSGKRTVVKYNDVDFSRMTDQSLRLKRASMSDSFPPRHPKAQKKSELNPAFFLRALVEKAVDRLKVTNQTSMSVQYTVSLQEGTIHIQPATSSL